MSTIALVIPSYQRPEQLDKALTAAQRQARAFDEMVVSCRVGDDATAEVARRHGARVAFTEAPGVLSAMVEGARATSTDIVAFSDDDAELTETWSETVLAIFARPENRDVGGIGGRDVLYDGDTPRATTLVDRVGEIGFFGRIRGNHHRGRVNNRPVVMLKGVNCAYRRAALGLPKGLRGEGAQAHFEIAVGAYAREHGWRLLYFSDLQVAHRPAPRRDDDQRHAPSARAVADSAFNLERALDPARATRRLLYVLVVGDRATPGVLRCCYAMLRNDRATLARRAPSWQGTIEAWRVRREPLRFTTFS